MINTTVENNLLYTPISKQYAHIIGVDPGVSHLALILYDWQYHKILKSTEIDIKKLDYSYKELYRLLIHILDSWTDYYVKLVYEKPFFTPITLGKNTRTLEVIGILKLACEECNVPFVEMSPAEIKKELTGKGKADKTEVANKVNELFNLGKVSFHIADAVATAYTYHNKYNKVNIDN